MAQELKQLQYRNNVQRVEKKSASKKHCNRLLKGITATLMVAAMTLGILVSGLADEFIYESYASVDEEAVMVVLTNATAETGLEISEEAKVVPGSALDKVSVKNTQKATQDQLRNREDYKKHGKTAAMSDEMSDTAILLKNIFSKNSLTNMDYIRKTANLSSTVRSNIEKFGEQLVLCGEESEETAESEKDSQDEKMSGSKKDTEKEKMSESEKSAEDEKASEPEEIASGLICETNSKFMMKLSDKDKEVLLRIVEAEAGDQDITGRILVANVILNRVLSKEWPNSVEEVVFQRIGGSTQFSPTRDGSYYKVKVSKDTKKAVNKCLEGVDYSQGAQYFFMRSGTTAKKAAWFDNSLTRLFKYGCHEFYK